MIFTSYDGMIRENKCQLTKFIIYLSNIQYMQLQNVLNDNISLEYHSYCQDGNLIILVLKLYGSAHYSIVFLNYLATNQFLWKS